MRKKIFYLAVAAIGMLTGQSHAQSFIKESVRVDFENNSAEVEVDVKQGYGTSRYDIVDNPVAYDGWDGADAPKDLLNTSEMCLEVERISALVWDAPVIRLKNTDGGEGIVVSALDASTHFLHIQALLPEGTVAGKGTLCINLFGHDWSVGCADPRVLADSNPAANKKWGEDYQAMTWVEFDFDLRPFIGKKITMVQIQAERGGSLQWYIDNVIIDNRRKDFPDYNFGTEVKITDDTDQMVIFYAGTSSCLTAQDQPAKGYAQASFDEYNNENGYQVWNVSKSEKTRLEGEALYNIEYDYSYLYGDGSLRPASESENIYWFASQLKNSVKHNTPLLVNATWSFLKPKFFLNDVNVESTKDTVSWIFVKNDPTAIAEYLKTVTIDVEKQIERGDYYIFYAGTNYCMTDQRLMGWQIGTDGLDSMYIPRNGTRGKEGNAIWPLILEEYNPELGDKQRWSVRNYSEDVDNEFSRTFFKNNGSTHINGHHPLVTERWHWNRNIDSTYRAVGARVITSKPYSMEYIDLDGEKKVIENYISIFGDNATVINDNNNLQWWVKQIPMNKDGICAIYRPNLGYQGVALKSRYAGGSLYASGGSATLAETQMYVWKFISIDNPILESIETSKQLINKDTVFGYPTQIKPGKYRIVYRGTNQVVTLDTTRIISGAKRNGLKISHYNAEAKEQIWNINTVTDPIDGYKEVKDQFTITNDGVNGDLRVYAPATTGNPLIAYTAQEASALGQNEKETYFKALTTNASLYGNDHSIILVANEKSRKFINTASQIVNASVGGYTNTGTLKLGGQELPEFPFVLQPIEDGLPEITRTFPEQFAIKEGWYQVQYAFGYDSEDPTKTYLLAPPQEFVQGVSNRMMPYNADSTHHRWYVVCSDTVATRLGQTPADPSYFFFDSKSVTDSVLAGKNGRDMIVNSYSTVLTDKNCASRNKYYEYSIFRLYQKDGLVAMKSSSNSWLVDMLSSKGLTNNIANNGSTNHANDINNERVWCFKLIPEGDEFSPVSEIPTWHPDYGKEAFVLGDVNNDGKVNVSDVVATVNSIIGNPNENYNAKAADLNSDGKVNVSDVVGIVNIILNPEFISKATSINRASGSLFIEGGKVMLSSTAAIGGFDFAYEGELTATETLKDFTLIPYMKDGKKRMIAYTMKRGVLNAGTSILFTTATGITISNLIFVAEDATELAMDNDVATSTEVSLNTQYQVISNASGIEVVPAIGVKSIEIQSTTGTTVATSTSATASTAKLAPSTYIVKVITDKGILTDKIIVK